METPADEDDDYYDYYNDLVSGGGDYNKDEVRKRCEGCCQKYPHFPFLPFIIYI